MRHRDGYPNRLGLKGWIAGGRWGPDRYLYTLHRVTGLGLVVYFVAHIVITSSRALGRDAWESAMGAVTGPVFVFGEYLVFLAFAFHAVNGLRLAMAEVGIGIGAPIEPVYPYKTSLDAQRPWVVIALLLVAVVAVIATFDFFVWN